MQVYVCKTKTLKHKGNTTKRVGDQVNVFNLGAVDVHSSPQPHKRFVVSALVAALLSLPLLWLQKSPSTSDLQCKWKHAEQARWLLPAVYSQAQQRAISATIPLQIPLKQNFLGKARNPKTSQINRFAH